MRRVLLLSLASLLLGTLTTIAIAWTLACTNIIAQGVSSSQRIRPERGPVELDMIGGPADGIRVNLFHAPGRSWLRCSCFGPEHPRLVGSPAYFYKPANLPPEQLVPAPARSIALPWLTKPDTSPWPRGGDADWREVELSGWPFLALASARVRMPNYTLAQNWGIVLSHRRIVGEQIFGPSPTSVLPLLPLWPNFALNALLFALAWLPLLLLSGAARRTLRRRRNLCPHCAYDLRATPPPQPCPECGHKRTIPTQ